MPPGTVSLAQSATPPAPSRPFRTPSTIARFLLAFSRFFACFSLLRNRFLSRRYGNQFLPHHILPQNHQKTRKNTERPPIIFHVMKMQVDFLLSRCSENGFSLALFAKTAPSHRFSPKQSPRATSPLRVFLAASKRISRRPPPLFPRFHHHSPKNSHIDPPHPQKSLARPLFHV